MSRKIVPHYPALVSERPLVSSPAWAERMPAPEPPRRQRGAFAAFLNSAGRLAASLALIAISVLWILFHAYWLRLPDAVLMRDYPLAPTVMETRTDLLAMVGLGVIFLRGSYSCFVEWRNSVAAWLKS